MQGEYQASQAHFMVGGKVRQTIKEIGGTTPEDLPTERHIKEVKREIKQFEKIEKKKLKKPE